MRRYFAFALAFVGCLFVVSEAESACLFGGRIRARIAARRSCGVSYSRQVTVIRYVTVIPPAKVFDSKPIEKMPKK